MANYAIINNAGTVINVTLWDGVIYNPSTGLGWTPPLGCTYQVIDNVSPRPSIGWQYINNTWVAPPPPATQPDIQGFTIAILSSPAITTVEKGYLLGALAALKDEIILGDNAVTEAGWQAIENSGDLSSTAISAILALAPVYAIPIS